MNVLTGAVSLGEIFGILLGDIVINKLEWGWHWFLGIFTLVLFCFSLAFYLGLREMPLEVAQENDLCAELQAQSAQATSIISQPNIFLVILEDALFSTLFYCMLTWYPYLFTVIGFPSYAPYFSIIPPLTYFCSPFFFEPLLSRC